MSPESTLPEEIWRMILCNKKPNLVHSVVLWQLCAYFSDILSDLVSNCLEKSLRNLLPYLTLNDLLKLRCVSGRLKEKVGHIMESSMLGRDDDTEDSIDDDDDDWKKRFFPLLKLNRNRLGDISTLLSFMDDYSMKGNLFVGRCVSISLELDYKEDEKDAFMEYLTRFGNHVEVIRLAVAMISVNGIRAFFWECLSLTKNLRKVELLPGLTTGHSTERLLYQKPVQLDLLERVTVIGTVYNYENGRRFRSRDDLKFLFLFGQQIRNLKKLILFEQCYFHFVDIFGPDFPFLTELQIHLILWGQNHWHIRGMTMITCPNLRKLTITFGLPEENANIGNALPEESSQITFLHLIFDQKNLQTYPLSFKERLPLTKLHTLKLNGAVPTRDILGLASISSLRKIELEVTEHPDSLDYLFTKIPSLTSYSLKILDNPKVTCNRDI